MPVDEHKISEEEKRKEEERRKQEEQKRREEEEHRRREEEQRREEERRREEEHREEERLRKEKEEQERRAEEEQKKNKEREIEDKRKEEHKEEDPNQGELPAHLARYLELPEDIWLLVIEMLGPRDLLALLLTNTRMHDEVMNLLRQMSADDHLIFTGQNMFQNSDAPVYGEPVFLFEPTIEHPEPQNGISFTASEILAMMDRGEIARAETHETGQRMFEALNSIEERDLLSPLREELYDPNVDGENIDLASRHPEIAAYLRYLILSNQLISAGGGYTDESLKPNADDINWTLKRWVKQAYLRSTSNNG